jgi:hypothetical protein
MGATQDSQHPARPRATSPRSFSSDEFDAVGASGSRDDPGREFVPGAGEGTGLAGDLTAVRRTAAR